MTRDEATRLVRDGGPIGGVYKSYDEALVDSLSALGILKLDEPKDEARELFMDVIEGYGDLQAGDAKRILASVEGIGLRVVKK